MSCRGFALALALLSLAPEAAAQAPAQPDRAQPPPLELPGAAGATPLLLRDALQRFRRESLELLAARYELTASRADVVSAGLLSNPWLSAQGAFVAHGIPSGGQQELYLSLSQNIPVAGQVGLRRDAAQGFASAQEREFAAVAWQLMGDLRLAYIDLQITEIKWRVVTLATRDLERVQSIIGERVAAGANAPYDRVRVAVERSALQASVAQSEAELVAARVALARAVGKDIDVKGLVVPEALDEPPEPPADEEALVLRALAQRSDVAAARMRVAASDLRTRSTARSYVPSPDVSVGYSRFFNIPTDAGPSGGGAITAGLSIPLPLFDRGQGALGRSNAEAMSARVRSQQTELLARREVESAAAVMRIRVVAWRRFRDIVAPDIERMRQMAELAYREGRASIVELLDAHSTYVEAKQRAADLRGAALKASVQLEQALGPSSPGAVPAP